MSWNDAQLLTIAIVALFVLLALVTIVRVILRREGRWTRIRVGLFIERDSDLVDDEERIG